LRSDLKQPVRAGSSKKKARHAGAQEVLDQMSGVKVNKPNLGGSTVNSVAAKSVWQRSPFWFKISFKLSFN